MITYRMLALVLLTGALFSGCNLKKNEVIPKPYSFTNNGEILRAQNIEFTFNKNLVPDSLLNKWDTTSYLEFSPRVEGRFKWNSTNDLMFSPATGFAPSTKYTVTVTPRLLKHADKKYRLTEEHAFSFHTPLLRIDYTSIHWTRVASGTVAIQCDIGFNEQVNLLQAAALTGIKSGGRSFQLQNISDTKGNILSFLIPPVSDEDKDIPVQITVQKGIKVLHSSYVTPKDSVIKTIIPSRYDLQITDVDAQHTGTEGVITVLSSQKIREEDLKQSITFSPNVPFTVETNEDGFTIISDQFQADAIYGMTISKNIEGEFGGKLRADFQQDISFGKLQPSISFVNNKGIYLPAQGMRNIALGIVNVPKVNLELIKVYENNIEQLFHNDQNWNGYYDSDNEQYYSFRYYNTEDIGDSIWGKTYDTKSLPRLNASRVLHLDFGDKMNSFKGIYILRVSSSNQYWLTDSKIISVSDVGLIVKQEKNNVWVFANSLKTAQPIAGVTIKFISTNNQTLYSATTNSDGVAEFDEVNTLTPGFRVGLITSSLGDDFNFVLLSNSRVETSRFDVGGKSPNDAGLSAFIYGDRTLYRPGEKISLSVIVRDDHWKSPGEVPVKVKLLLPNGKEYITVRKILDEQGAMETSISIPVASITGVYTAEVYTANDVLLNSENINVEEFMPDRIKVNLNLSKPSYTIGDSIVATAQALNLFGPPAANRNYQYQLDIKPDIFSAKNFTDYQFNTTDTSKSITNETDYNHLFREGKTSPEGRLSQSFYIDPSLRDHGLLRGEALLTVFDEDGRPVSRMQSFPVYSQSVFYGIKSAVDYIPTRTPANFKFVAVDQNGAMLSNASAQITIVQKLWQTILVRSNRGYTYESDEEDRIVQTRTISLSGVTDYSFTPIVSGDYEVRISRPGAITYVADEFYSYGWGDTQYTSFEVDNEGNITIKADKDKYQPGEEVKALLTTPFDGNLLVTVERDKVYQYYYLKTNNQSASIDFTASDDDVPNIYITATLIRPMGESAIPLVIAHGFLSLLVDKSSAKLPVSISVASQSRSQTNQTIRVKTNPYASVTIAAVDEGILQITNQQTPDPYGFFYAKQALQVNSFDIYPQLLPEIHWSSSSTGGDAGVLQKRVNPIVANRVNLVSNWSGILHADANGDVSYTITIPQFSGDIRVMAATYRDASFGSADAHIKVADPIVISSALPRFLSPKDTVIMSLTLSNTTSGNAASNISIKATGPVSVSGNSVQQISVPANSEQLTQFKICAGRSTGKGSVLISVNALGETFTNNTELSVRPYSSLQKMTDAGEVEAGNTKTINISDDFIPGTGTGKLLLSRSPLVQFADNLNYLIQYPYGCVEQTVSSAFPQLYYDDLVKSLYGTTNKDINPNYNVQAAITKLQSMQMFNGALSFWPGEGYESWWGTIYAAHFLIEAKKAGFEINDVVLKNIYDYLRFKLREKNTVVYYFDQNISREVCPEEVPYSLFVLALAGQPDIPTLNYYKSNPQILTADSKYMIAAAYALTGDKSKYLQMVPGAFGNDQILRMNNGSFASYIRDEALALYCLLEVDPDNPQVGTMAQQLSQELKKDQWLNTQEQAFVFLDFGEIARRANQSTATATVSIQGAVAGTMNGKNLSLDISSALNQPVSISVKGNGKLYYFFSKEGISATGKIKQEDSYLKVRRYYYDRFGNPVLNGTFEQNDLVVVRVSLQTLFTKQVDNIVVTDMLPAGFEMENPRIADIPDLNWIKNNTEPDYSDYRDDRLNLFTTADGDEKNFYYVLRAVTPGTYQLGPIQADAMYNNEIHSYNGAGVMRVTEKNYSPPKSASASSVK